MRRSPFLCTESGISNEEVACAVQEAIERYMHRLNVKDLVCEIVAIAVKGLFQKHPGAARRNYLAIQEAVRAETEERFVTAINQALIEALERTDR